MKNLSLYVFGVVISLAIVLFTPKYFLELLGCWQIGSWIGDFINKRLEK